MPLEYADGDERDPRKAINVYEAHAIAVQNWVNACNQLHIAQAQREEARLELASATKQLSCVLESCLQDPTEINAVPEGQLAGAQVGAARRR